MLIHRFRKKYPHFALFAWKNLKVQFFFFILVQNKLIWMQLQHSFQNVLIIPPITPQGTIFGFTDHKVNYHLKNHILYLNIMLIKLEKMDH